MRDPIFDKPKSLLQIRKDLDKTCKVCGKPVSNFEGPGSDALCREHQIQQREYGGMGRIDRPHTFHRDWICDECGYNALEDPRLTDIKDEMTKRRVARVLMHGDHQHRQADGGNDSKENVRSLCFVCHAKKTILNEDWRKK
jgi:5-methylcytosine-specific restriction endonuclease McrA